MKFKKNDKVRIKGGELHGKIVSFDKANIHHKLYYRVTWKELPRMTFSYSEFELELIETGHPMTKAFK
jgi:hypothetical protein